MYRLLIAFALFNSIFAIESETNAQWVRTQLAKRRSTRSNFRYEGGLKDNTTVYGCGQSYLHRFWMEKIVGGRDVDIREHPYIVSLQTKKFGRTMQHYCGGTLINSRWVLTAAHCVDGFAANDIQVQVGQTNLNAKATTGLKILVEKIVSHRGYNSENLANDIALLKLASPIRAVSTPASKGSPGEKIQAACLPLSADQFKGLSQVTGWGRMSENGRLSDTLKSVDVELMSDSECRTMYGDRIHNEMICAGFIAGGKDACQGDSGGPLVKVIEGRNVLIGVVSWGFGCARPRNPGVYTEVSMYRDWIDGVVRTF